MGSIDWGTLRTEADDATKPLDIGKYNVVCTKAEAKTFSTGSTGISATLEVEGGPKNGRNLFTNMVLTPDKPFALKMFFDSTGAFGLDANFFAQGPEMEQVAAALVGRRAIADVGIKQYQGQDRNEVRSLQASGANGSVPTTMPVVGGPPVPVSAAPSGPPVPTVAPIGTPAAGVTVGPISVAPTVTDGPPKPPTSF